MVGTESLLYFAKYDAGAWTLLGQPNTTSNVYSTAGLTSFSTFTGGEAGSLPVHLQSLYSTVSGRNVTISWVTTSENNNTGFEVLRTSVDKNGTEGNYLTQGFVKGNGTTTQQKSYNFTDKNLSTGKYKYRLKQIDNNGNYEYFELNGFVEIGLPNKYSVSQNYPNPFNPTTKIDFELPADSKITMVIFDISGKEVAKVLNNEFKNAGYHTADFNASKLSSGIYFYRLTADNFSVTKKMMLIK
ncbi:MAG: T9SS type A sorting domain-containing protein [Ignavibacteriae bacterium]|nr:T9SS type A sorting domain-containing protein [Ignavibacteriota bacterium]